LCGQEAFPQMSRLKIVTRSILDLSKVYTVSDLEEPGEQCTVVFAQIVTERACARGGGNPPPPQPPSTHSLAGSVTINAKTTVHFSPDSSMVAGKQTSKLCQNIKTHGQQTTTKT
jgi:hypothetical protein